MKNIGFKRTLSALLTICVVFSMLTIAVVSASGDITLKADSTLSFETVNGTNLLKGVKERQTVASVLADFESSNGITVTKDGVALADDDFVGTGTVISTESISVSVVVLGDIDGDGSVSITDYMQIKSALINNTALDATSLLAADTSADGKIDTVDYAQVKSYFLGLYNIYPEINDDDTSDSSEDESVEESSEDVSVEESSEDVSVEESSEDVSVEESSEDVSVEESSEDVSVEESSEDVSADSSVEESSEEVSADSSIEESSEEVSYTYILNVKSKKIHLATCSGAKTISEANRKGYNGDIADLIAEGYTTCGTCKPDQYEEPSEAPSVDSSDDSSVDSSTDSSETPSEEPSEEEVSYTYILNTKSKKIHLATCSGAKTISEANRQGYNGDIADLIAEGYTTCGTCKPDQE